jgi:hypothetical protein
VCSTRDSVPSLDRRERLEGMLGDEILAGRGNHKVEKRWCRLLPGLICFRVVAPPL